MDVSVIVPVYNQEKYLRECLDSVVAQDLSDFEVILINDGSSDSSEEICLEYTEKYNFFLYVCQQNTGLGGARNTGLTHARGEYIFFLDSDDAILKNSISKLLAFAKKNRADIVYFDEIVCDEKLIARSVARTYPGMDTVISKRRALEESMHPSHIWARLYRRQLFEEIQFANIWYEDVESFPRLLAKAEALYYYKVPLYCYRQHKEGITYQNADKRNLDVITAWKNIYSIVGLAEEERKAVEYSIRKSILTFLFFRPQYARDYAEFYNRVFAGEKGDCIAGNPGEKSGVERTPLWQQAEFYERKDIIAILKGLNGIYDDGGALVFDGDRVVLRKQFIQREAIVFTCGEAIVLRQIRLRKRSTMIADAVKELSCWNLVSLKNEIKELNFTKMIVEKAIMNGVKMEVLT